ncbi:MULTISPECIES: DUF4159 domain-containing protein [Cyanophyceae]|uniref:DUF4159 domain-containing protein n=2 Tax=Cyanobacteriota TaxID=1117 RepID=UPI0023312944|nr:MULTISPECIES: DUF4159 domain-containing protein [Cyanophyceae]MDB9357049.1 DUF4159 domain-containing protein [Nodularia spumigena CS-587/03]MDB9316995.1 DUF4159 domain-containing protein [Nodularia spumigena CS-590/01A]MDB9323952.1 DUF4159 domain-containing protein [Nodularia spumigena CS-591/07A]MDB9332453.1 DUF4159 domain-containing protein [Nodularia spumigena CS-591/04]MDB9335057.1 DUF4159 domain-containing protein [Nodularia spumigena CS-590/01]
MTHPFPPPQIQPLERLQATDGLLINAERWSKAHEYHRLRQNTHYQSLNQPGIVCGLGVRVIPAPRQVEAKYRDGRWVQIQPGIAIDVNGNLIVVPKSYDFPIDLEVVSSEPLMIYLVASYVDPDELRRGQQRDIVQETYRLDQKNSTLESTEIEICRILLQPGQNTIYPPADTFYPGYNNLDLRYRRQAQARPQAFVRMAQVSHSDGEYARNFFNLAYLLQSLEALYPHLRGADEPNEVSLSENIQEYDLLYLTGQQSLTFNNVEFEALKEYLNLGGVLLVDAPLDANALIESTHALAQQLEIPLRPLAELQRSHPLRTRPFLFAALPIINQQLIQLFTGGGIILVVGDLASAWGIDREFNLPRLTIRVAQELGINILNYAWKRRQLIGLQQQDNSGQW